MCLVFYSSSFKVSDTCPTKSAEDHLLLKVGTELYKVCPNPDALLPYLIKDNPLLPVIYNHRIQISVNTTGEIKYMKMLWS